jgi:heat shock protein HslJ
MTPVEARIRTRPRPSIGTAFAALAACVVLLTVGCGSDGDSSSTTTTVAATPLEGTTWNLTTGGGMGANLVPAGVTARFEAGTMSGSTGCNEYTAPYKLDGQDLTIGPNIASTQKACDGPVAAVEAAYLAILPKVAGFSITLTALTLNDAELHAILIYQASA